MKKLLFGFLLIAMCLGVKAQIYGWNYSKSLSNISINNICCISEDTVILVGSGGIILKTTNGGETWEQKESNTTENLYCVEFINDTLGFAVGGYFDNGTILRTTDGGENWVSIENKFDFDITGFVYYNIAVSNTNSHCVITGYKYNHNYYSILMISHDMGETWSVDSTFYANKWIGDICMQSDLLLVSINDSILLKTNNDGVSYDTILQDYMIKDVIINGNDLLVVTNDSLQKSSDFGDSWQNMGTSDDFHYWNVKLSAFDSCTLFVYSADMPGEHSRFYNYCDDVFSDMSTPTLYPTKFIGNTGYGINHVNPNCHVYKWGVNANAECEKTENIISIYPNPTSSFFTLRFPNMETEGLEYSIYDVMGRLVERNIIDNMSVTIDNSNWQSGIYEIIVSKQGEIMHSEKIIKE